MTKSWVRPWLTGNETVLVLEVEKFTGEKILLFYARVSSEETFWPEYLALTCYFLNNFVGVGAVLFLPAPSVIQPNLIKNLQVHETF